MHINAHLLKPHPESYGGAVSVSTERSVGTSAGVSAGGVAGTGTGAGGGAGSELVPGSGPGAAPSAFARLLGQSQRRGSDAEPAKPSNPTTSSAQSAEPRAAVGASRWADGELPGLPGTTGALKRTAGRALGHHKPMRELPVGAHSALHSAALSSEKALRGAKAKDSDSEPSARATDDAARQVPGEMPSEMPDDPSAALMNAQVHSVSSWGAASDAASGPAAKNPSLAPSALEPQTSVDTATAPSATPPESSPAAQTIGSTGGAAGAGPRSVPDLPPTASSTTTAARTAPIAVAVAVDAAGRSGVAATSTSTLTTGTTVTPAAEATAKRFENSRASPAVPFTPSAGLPANASDVAVHALASAVRGGTPDPMPADAAVTLPAAYWPPGPTAGALAARQALATRETETAAAAAPVAPLSLDLGHPQTPDKTSAPPMAFRPEGATAVTAAKNAVTAAATTAATAAATTTATTAESFAIPTATPTAAVTATAAVMATTAVAKEFAVSNAAHRLSPPPGLGDKQAPAGPGPLADRPLTGWRAASASAPASAFASTPEFAPVLTPASAVPIASLPTTLPAASVLSALADGSRPLASSARRPADSFSDRAVSHPGTDKLNALAALAALGGLMSSPVSPFAVPQAVVSVNIPEPANAPEFREALGARVSFLAADGVQQAELHLNPAEMGPISVRIVLDGSQAHVEFGADSAATRQIIEAGLPELASALREAGLTLSGGGVSQHAREPEVRADLPAQAQNNTQNGAQADPQAQQQNSGSRSPQDRAAGTQRGNAGRGNGDSADPATLSAQAARQRMRVSAGGVDVYA